MPFPTPRPPNPLLRVGRSHSGFGIFATGPIPTGRFLMEYWGELVPTEDANKVGGRYLFDLENGKTILGGTRKNTARYINHACVPNAEVRIAKNRVFIHAIKPIKTGEELSYDYGTEYFEAFIGEKHCRCKRCVKRREAKRTTKKAPITRTPRKGQESEG